MADQIRFPTITELAADMKATGEAACRVAEQFEQSEAETFRANWLSDRLGLLCELMMATEMETPTDVMLALAAADLHLSSCLGSPEHDREFAHKQRVIRVLRLAVAWFEEREGLRALDLTDHTLGHAMNVDPLYK